MSESGPPVSISFFCGAEKLLRKRHGKRSAGSWEALDKLRGALGTAEELYKALPPVVNDKKTPTPQEQRS